MAKGVRRAAGGTGRSALRRLRPPARRADPRRRLRRLLASRPGLHPTAVPRMRRPAAATARRGRLPGVPEAGRRRGRGQSRGTVRWDASAHHSCLQVRRPTVAGGALASLLRRQAGDLLARTDLLVPVPLHWSRHHARGFNQAADLAVHLGEPVAHALRRTVRTATQVTLPSARRHANVRAAFALRSQRWRAAGDRRDLLAGASITLVDDVCTTGATLQACGQVLKQAGARRIWALMLAKVWT